MLGWQMAIKHGSLKGYIIMQALFEQWGLMELSELTIVVRLVMAVICSGALGLERTRKRRPAGLRTYMLVCIGAAVVMMTSQFLAELYPSADPGRMPSQVICGIGFLGAGTIMITRYYRVKGLTTAAGLWGAACMGLSIGIGFYFGAMITCLVIIAVMIFADKFETMYTRRLHRLHLYIIFSDVSCLKPFMREMRASDVEVNDVETAKSDDKSGIGLFCLLRFPPALNHDRVLSIVTEFEGVLFVEEIDA